MGTAPARKAAITVIAVCLGAMMFGLEISSVPVILPTLQKALHGNLDDLQWIATGYTIACTTVMMAAGTLADRYGRRLIFLISLVLFGVTSLACGLAQDVGVLVVARFLQGFSGGAMMSTLVAILSAQFTDGRARARAFAVFGVVFGAGLGFGPIIGGLIVAVSSWRWVFLMHVPLTALTIALVAWAVSESRDGNPGKLDLPGIITLSLTVFALTYVITQGPEVGWGDAWVIGAVAVVAVGLVLFVVAERVSDRPMVDFSVLRIRNFSGALVGSAAMNFSFWPFIIFLPIYFQTGLGYGVIGTSLSLMAYTMPTLLVPPLAERLSLRFQPKIVIPLGLFIIGAGFLLMRLGSGDHASWLTMLPGALVAGVGLGVTNTPVTNTITGSVPGDRAGMASGIDLTTRFLSLSVNIALMGFILLTGVTAALTSTPPAGANVHDLATKVAAGTPPTAPDGAPALAATAIHDALSNGFGFMLLYGGLAVWLLAALSRFIFGFRAKGSLAAAGAADVVPAAADA